MFTKQCPELRALGDRVRFLRTEAGLSQEKLTQQAGLSRGYLGKIETANCNPSYGVLLSLARGLDMDLGEVLQGIDPQA